MQNPIDQMRALFPEHYLVMHDYLFSLFSTYEGETRRYTVPKDFHFGRLDFLNQYDCPFGFGKRKLLDGFEIEGDWELGLPLLETASFKYNGKPVPVYIHELKQWRDEEDWRLDFEKYRGQRIEIKNEVIWKIGNSEHFIQCSDNYEYFEVLDGTTVKTYSLGMENIVEWDIPYWDEIGEEIAYGKDHGENTRKLLRLTTGDTWNRFLGECADKSKELDKDGLVEWVKCNLPKYTDGFRQEMLQTK